MSSLVIELTVIIDYVGIFKSLRKAFEMYEEEDIEGAAYDLDTIKKEIKEKMEQAFSLFDFPLSYDRDILDRAAIILEEKIDDFRKLYFAIRNLYRLLLEEKLEFKDKFDLLSEVYHVYLQRTNRLDAEIEQKRDQFYKEALKFIHETIDIDRIKTDYPVVAIDDEFLSKIRSDKKRRRFYDLLFAVRAYTRESSDEDIVEKVDRIVKDWNERKKDADLLYEELTEVAEIINREKKEMQRLGLNQSEYRILKLLRSYAANVDDSILVNSIKEMLNEIEDDTFPGWYEKGEVVKEIERKILLFLIKKFKDIDAVKARDDIVRFLKIQAERERLS